jgi:CRP-like cAMP-binding protein
MEKPIIPDEMPFVNLLEHLSPEIHSELNANSELLKLNKSDLIFGRYAPSEKMYIVKKGRVKLFTTDGEGKEVLKNLIHTGELFGESAIFCKEKRDENAAAMDDQTEVLELSGDAAAALMKKYPEFAYKLTLQITEKLRSAEKRIEALNFQNSRTRIIEFLKDVARRQGRKVGYETLLRPFLTHQDIGSLTTTSRQTVSSVLNELKGSNKIYYDRHRLLIRDIAGL